MPQGYGLGYGTLGPNPWGSANAAQFLGPGSRFQTKFAAARREYFTRAFGTASPPPSVYDPVQNLMDAPGRPSSPLDPKPRKGFWESILPQRKYDKQPRNPVVPAGSLGPYNGSAASPDLRVGSTLRITWPGGSPPPQLGTVNRITVPQDAAQTAKQMGRKQVKLPDVKVVAPLAGGVLLLSLL